MSLTHSINLLIRSDIMSEDLQELYQQKTIPSQIVDTAFIPDAYKHRDAFLRKLLTVSATEDVATAVRNVINVLLSDKELNIDYISILQWSEERKEMSYIGTNVEQEYTTALLKHINLINWGTSRANLLAFVNNKEGVLTYPSAKARGIHFEYYVPLVFGDKLIGALYLETCSNDCTHLLDLQVFELFFINLGLVLNNILLIQRILRQSNIDALTKLYNRRYMDSYFSSLELIHVPYAMIMFDIDYFKQINDTYGHAAGDMVLQLIANVLLSNIRSSEDIVFRYGGEEFLIVLINADANVAFERAEDIRHQVAALNVFVQPDVNVKLTVSAGVADSTMDASSAGGICVCADSALYKAKERGRNRVEVGVCEK